MGGEGERIFKKKITAWDAVSMGSQSMGCCQLSSVSAVPVVSMLLAVVKYGN